MADTGDLAFDGTGGGRMSASDNASGETESSLLAKVAVRADWGCNLSLEAELSSIV